MAICEWCGKETSRLETHHLIPRWCGGDDSEENTMEVCHGSHRILETMFERFFKYGTFKGIPEWRSPEDIERRRLAQRAYSRKYKFTKHLFQFTPIPHVVVLVQLDCNSRTQYVGIRESVRLR